MNVEEMYDYLEKKHTFTVGITESGKSTIIKNIVRDFAISRPSNKFLIFNTQLVPFFRTLGVNTNCYETTMKSFSENQITVYNPQLRFTSEPELNEISLILQQIFLIQNHFKGTDNQKRIIIIADEIQQYCDKTYGISVKEFPLIATRGLHYKITLLTISQKIQQVHNAILSQCANLIFGILSNNDYDLAKHYFNELPKESPIKEYFEFWFCNWKELQRIQ